MSKRGWHIPHEVWWWAGTVLIVLVVAMAPLVALQLGPDREQVMTTAGVIDLVLDPVALVAALLLYFYWRLKRTDATAWLSAALIAASVKGLSLAVTRLVAPDTVSSHAGLIMLLDLVFVLLIIGMVTLLPRRGSLRVDPALLGLGVGVLFTVVRSALLELDPVLSRESEVLAAGNLVLIAAHVCFAWAVLHLGFRMRWSRALPVAVILLGVGNAVSYPMFDATYLDVSALVANTVATLLLSGTAVALLHATMRDSATTVDELSDRVAEVEEGVRADRERLHEINATIAGIATATRLMHDRPEMEPDCKHLLEEMLTSEIDRLERLVEGREAEPDEVDLDHTVHKIVTTQQAMGRDVRWEPGGLRTCASEDTITEVLTTLLNNAAEHAPGSPVSIDMRQVRDRAEIRVADHGPGVATDMADRIFEWGERGGGSHGQGIGLAVAKRLINDLGGSLFVLPAQNGTGRGAVFVITLPTARHTDGAAHARAQ